MNAKATLAMLLRHLALTCAFILGAPRFIVAAPEDFYPAHIPEGVKMGMSPEELAKARSTARSTDMSGFDHPAGEKPPVSPAEMAEFRRERDRASVTAYRFKAGKLSAVIESTQTHTRTTIVPIEQTLAVVNKLAQGLKENFALKRQDQIVRTTGGVTALLTVQLWEDKAKGLHLYFLATNQEITLVIFDPNVAGRADFFADPETLEKTKANSESIRRQLGERADPPLPLVDLLAEPPTEKK